MDFNGAQAVFAVALLAWGAVWWMRRCVLAQRTALRTHLSDPQTLLWRRRGGSPDDERRTLLLPVARLEGTP
jgi:hypothetical protein